MQLMTFDSVLTYMCDYFDELISPRKMTRSNTNIGYLILKAVSKGIEVINNVCVVLSNKFNPANCSDEDLTSVAYLVGTAKLEGAQSGLRVTAYNASAQPVILLAGEYTYTLNNETTFYCILSNDIEIAGERDAELIFLSEHKGQYAVTAQSEIAIGSSVEIPSSVTFSCTDNDNLLGYEDESNVAFRKRILTDTTRQDAVNELKLKLRNLPYVYDCEIVFNQDSSSTSVGDFTVPPYYMLILLSTAMYKEEIAEIVASSAIYPTVNVAGVSHEIKYFNSVFANGFYPVYINDFARKQFKAYVTVKINTEYISTSLAYSKMRSRLFAVINSNTHSDIITTEDIFLILEDMNLNGVNILAVQLYVNDVAVTYVECAKSEIGELTEVDFGS